MVPRQTRRLRILYIYLLTHTTSNIMGPRETFWFTNSKGYDVVHTILPRYVLIRYIRTQIDPAHAADIIRSPHIVGRE